MSAASLLFSINSLPTEQELWEMVPKSPASPEENQYPSTLIRAPWTKIRSDYFSAPPKNLKSKISSAENSEKKTASAAQARLPFHSKNPYALLSEDDEE